jgi:hypothetical protein
LALKNRPDRRIPLCPAFFVFGGKTAMAGFKVEYQMPRPKIEIIPPDGSRVVLAPDYTGVSEDGKSITGNNLLSYAFSESVDDLTGSFSFSVENEMVLNSKTDNAGRSLFDLIPRRGVVNIYEDDKETPVFRGIIRKRHMGATMTANGVKKSVVFSGESIISCVTNFMVPLDMRIPGVSGSTAKTKKLQAELGEDNMTIGSFMKKTWEYFRKVSDEVSSSSGLVNGRLLEIINNKDFIGEDFIQVTGREISLQYPVATMFYNQINQQPQGKPCGIEDFFLKALCMRGNKYPPPPGRSAPRGGGLNPKRATPLIIISLKFGATFYPSRRMNYLPVLMRKKRSPLL